MHVLSGIDLEEGFRMFEAFWEGHERRSKDKATDIHGEKCPNGGEKPNE